MHLDEYLFRNKLSKKEFASIINVSPKTLWSLLNKETDIKLSIAIKIEEATQGQVTCRELLKGNLQQETESKKQPRTKKR